MKKKPIRLLDTAALLENVPARKLRVGEIGTVVELLGSDAYEVEFFDDEGQTYARFALRWDQLLPLHSAGRSLKVALVEA